MSDMFTSPHQAQDLPFKYVKLMIFLTLSPPPTVLCSKIPSLPFNPVKTLPPSTRQIPSEYEKTILTNEK